MTTPNVPYGVSNTAGANFYDTYTPPTSGSQLFGTPAPFAVGTIVDGTGGSKWVYVLYSTGGMTGQGYVVTFNSAFTAVMMSNTVGALGDKIGVPCHAAAVAGDYGWVQVYGIAPNVRASAASGANVNLASSVTAGAISATVTTPTKNLPGIQFTVAPGAAGLFQAELNWPTVGTTN